MPGISEQAAVISFGVDDGMSDAIKGMETSMTSMLTHLTALSKSFTTHTEAIEVSTKATVEVTKVTEDAVKTERGHAEMIDVARKSMERSLRVRNQERDATGFMKKEVQQLIDTRRLHTRVIDAVRNSTDNFIRAMLRQNKVMGESEDQQKVNLSLMEKLRKAGDKARDVADKITDGVGNKLGAIASTLAAATGVFAAGKFQDDIAGITSEVSLAEGAADNLFDAMNRAGRRTGASTADLVGMSIALQQVSSATGDDLEELLVDTNLFRRAFKLQGQEAGEFFKVLRLEGDIARDGLLGVVAAIDVIGRDSAIHKNQLLQLTTEFIRSGEAFEKIGKKHREQALLEFSAAQGALKNIGIESANVGQILDAAFDIDKGADIRAQVFAATEKLTGVGVNLEEKLKAGDIAGAMQAIVQTIGTLPEGQLERFTSVFSEAFGEGFDASFLLKMSGNVDKFGTSLASLRKTGMAAFIDGQATLEKSAAQNDTVFGRLDRITQKLMHTFTALAKPLLDVVEGVFDAVVIPIVDKLVMSIDLLSDGWKSTVAGAVALGGFLGPIISGFNGLLGVIGKIIPGLEPLTSRLIGFANVFRGGIMKGVRGFFSLIVNGLTKIPNLVTGAVDGIRKLFGFFDSVGDRISKFLKPLGRMSRLFGQFGKLFLKGGLIGIALSVGEQLIDFVKDLGDVFSGEISGGEFAKRTIANFLQIFSEPVTDVLDVIASVASMLGATGIAESISAISDGFKDAVNSVSNFFTGQESVSVEQQEEEGQKLNAAIDSLNQESVSVGPVEVVQDTVEPQKVEVVPEAQPQRVEVVQDTVEPQKVEVVPEAQPQRVEVVQDTEPVESFIGQDGVSAITTAITTAISDGFQLVSGIFDIFGDDEAEVNVNVNTRTMQEGGGVGAAVGPGAELLPIPESATGQEGGLIKKTGAIIAHPGEVIGNAKDLGLVTQDSVVGTVPQQDFGFSELSVDDRAIANAVIESMTGSQDTGSLTVQQLSDAIAFASAQGASSELIDTFKGQLLATAEADKFERGTDLMAVTQDPLMTDAIASLSQDSQQVSDADLMAVTQDPLGRSPSEVVAQAKFQTDVVDQTATLPSVKGVFEAQLKGILGIGTNGDTLNRLTGGYVADQRTIGAQAQNSVENFIFKPLDLLARVLPPELQMLIPAWKAALSDNIGPVFDVLDNTLAQSIDALLMGDFDKLGGIFRLGMTDLVAALGDVGRGVLDFAKKIPFVGDLVKKTESWIDKLINGPPRPVVLLDSEPIETIPTGIFDESDKLPEGFKDLAPPPPDFSDIPGFNEINAPKIPVPDFPDLIPETVDLNIPVLDFPDLIPETVDLNIPVLDFPDLIPETVDLNIRVPDFPDIPIEDISFDIPPLPDLSVNFSDLHMPDLASFDLPDVPDIPNPLSNIPIDGVAGEVSGKGRAAVQAITGDFGGAAKTLVTSTMKDQAVKRGGDAIKNTKLGGQALGKLGPVIAALPAAKEAFENILAGDFKGALNSVAEAVVSGIVTVGLTPFIGPIAGGIVAGIVAGPLVEGGKETISQALGGASDVGGGLKDIASGDVLGGLKGLAGGLMDIGLSPLKGISTAVISLGAAFGIGGGDNKRQARGKVLDRLQNKIQAGDSIFDSLGNTDEKMAMAIDGKAEGRAFEITRASISRGFGVPFNVAEAYMAGVFGQLDTATKDAVDSVFKESFGGSVAEGLGGKKDFRRFVERDIKTMEDFKQSSLLAQQQANRDRLALSMRHSDVSADSFKEAQAAAFQRTHSKFVIDEDNEGQILREDAERRPQPLMAANGLTGIAKGPTSIIAGEGPKPEFVHIGSAGSGGGGASLDVDNSDVIAVLEDILTTLKLTRDQQRRNPLVDAAASLQV